MQLELNNNKDDTFYKNLVFISKNQEKVLEVLILFGGFP